MRKADTDVAIVVVSQDHAGFDAKPMLSNALGATPIRMPLQGDAADTVLSVNDLGDFARFTEVLDGTPGPHSHQSMVYCDCTLTRIVATLMPFLAKASARRGCSCRNLADTAALAASKVQPSSSIGPALTYGAIAGGRQTCTAARHSCDARKRCMRLAKVPDRSSAFVTWGTSGTMGL